MKRSDAFKSNYLGKGDLERPVIATIQDVVIEKLEGDDGPQEKPICHFTNGTKPLVLNQVNWTMIEAAYGEETDNWRGRQVEVYYDPNIMFGAKRVGGVRVRMPQQAQTYTATTASPPINNVDLEKRAAWTGFKVKFHDGTPDEKAELFKLAVQKYFKGKPSELITAQEWNQFAKDGFELRVPNPISNEPVVDLADCPF